MNLNPFKKTKQDDSTEEKKEPHSVKASRGKKTSFQHLWVRLGILAAIAFIGFSIVNARLSSQKQKTVDDNILGAEEHVIDEPSTQEIIDEIANEAQKKSTEVGGSVLGVAAELVDDTKEDVSSTVTKTIVDVTVNSLISQIEKLPGVQKDEVKKYICE